MSGANFTVTFKLGCLVTTCNSSLGIDFPNGDKNRRTRVDFI